MRLIILFLFLSLQATSLTAQPGKAQKAFDKALEHYSKKEYTQAIGYLNKAIAAYPAFTNAFLLRADSYRELSDTTAAINDYKVVAELNPEKYPGVRYSVGYLAFLQGDYETAWIYLAKYISEIALAGRENLKDEAEFYLRHASFAREAIKHPIELNERNIGDFVNSAYDEYVNDISLDGSMLYFTRKHKSDPQSLSGRQLEEDFFMSSLIDSEWVNAIMMPPPLNSPYDDGALDISADGMLALFTSNRPGGHGRFDLYFALRKGDRWGAATNLGPRVNSASWDSQPTLAPDGRTLYFVSDRAGGLGGSDIYSAKLQDDGSWSKARNLGPEINTPRNEMTPVIHPDGKTMYFASEGHPGFGQMDLFVSRLQADDTWSEPRNLGYPLNTKSSEINFVIHPNGRVAYFSRLIAGKGMDIIEIDLPAYARPEPITYVQGFITDDQSGKGLEAVFRLVELASGQTIIEAASDAFTGSFMVTLPANRDYALFAEREGYQYHSESFSIQGEHPYEKPYRLNIRLKKVGEGAWILKNIFFDVDHYNLKPESNVELDKFVSFLMKNPALKAEIGGHTDNTGSVEHNNTLSMNRAKAVYDYLVNKGIPADRLTYRGYGMDQPVDTNDTVEGRANNRRTEINFIK